MNHQFTIKPTCNLIGSKLSSRPESSMSVMISHPCMDNQFGAFHNRYCFVNKVFEPSGNYDLP